MEKTYVSKMCSLVLISLLIGTSAIASVNLDALPQSDCTVSLTERGGSGWSERVNAHITKKLEKLGCSVVEKGHAKYDISWGFGCIIYSRQALGPHLKNLVFLPVVGEPQNLFATLTKEDGSVMQRGSLSFQERSLHLEIGSPGYLAFRKAEKVLNRFVESIAEAEGKAQIEPQK